MNQKKKHFLNSSTNQTIHSGIENYFIAQASPDRDLGSSKPPSFPHHYFATLSQGPNKSPFVKQTRQWLRDVAITTNKTKHTTTSRYAKKQNKKKQVNEWKMRQRTPRSVSIPTTYPKFRNIKCVLNSVIKIGVVSSYFRVHSSFVLLVSLGQSKDGYSCIHQVGLATKTKKTLSTLVLLR